MNHRYQSLLKLAFCLAVVALMWGVLLPRLSRQDAIQQHLDWLAAERIDPSAMYYTELECMPDLLRDGGHEAALGSATPPARR